MKKQSVFYSLTRVAIILTAAFFFGVQADDKKGGKDPRAEKFRLAEEKIWSAVKAGKLSKAAAQKHLGAIKNQIWADKGKKQNRGGKDSRAEKFRAAEEKIWSAVKAGKLSKEAAQKKLAGLKKEIWGGNLKKDSGDNKGSGAKNEGYDKREAKYHSFEKEIWGAVKAGKLSKEAAQKKLAGLKKEIWGGDQKKISGNRKKGSGDKKEGYDKREAKYHSFEKEIWGAVKAGKLSKEAANKKLAGLKKEIWGGDLKKDWDAQKKLGVTKAHVQSALTKGTNCSACHVHKKDWDKMDLGWDKKDWDGKKDRDGKKGRDGKSASDIEVLKRQLEALKRENEGLRKRLEGRKDR